MKVNLVNKYDKDNYLETIEKITKITGNLFSLNEQNINVILVSDSEIKMINSTYRDKNQITDVITFPDGTHGNQGDIFISIDKCKEQANEFGHSFERELGFLMVHGLLHTLGYDHQTKEEEKEMIEMQDKILHKAKLYR